MAEGREKASLSGKKKTAPEGAAVHREETPRKGNSIRDAVLNRFTLRCSIKQDEFPRCGKKFSKVRFGDAVGCPQTVGNAKKPPTRLVVNEARPRYI